MKVQLEVQLNRTESRCRRVGVQHRPASADPSHTSAVGEASCGGTEAAETKLAYHNAVPRHSSRADTYIVLCPINSQSKA
jgi:hypothetical protein